MAFTVPSCPGLDVTFALPASVSITVPLTRMFRLTKCLFAGHSTTALIGLLVNFLVFGSRQFANCDTRTFIFLLFPLVVTVLTFCFPTFVIVGSLPISKIRFLRIALYNPPEGFLCPRPRCITTIHLLCL